MKSAAWRKSGRALWQRVRQCSGFDCSFQIATEIRKKRTITGMPSSAMAARKSQCGWCKDGWGLSWQITPCTLTDAFAAGGGEAKSAFETMMTLKKIDIATIEAARRG
jgi:predicted 3-demethylubiquinone-9 3-methyltransferase (glyoxalase superfamily)